MTNRQGFFGTVFTWIAGGALALDLLMIAGLVALLAWMGMGCFWPRAMLEVRLTDGTRVWGELRARERIGPLALSEEDRPQAAVRYRIQLKIANRDLHDLDFRWVAEADIAGIDRPPDLVHVERTEWGDFFGRLRELRTGGRKLDLAGPELWPRFEALLDAAPGTTTAVFETAVGGPHELRLDHILRAIRPNTMPVEAKVVLYLRRIVEFLAGAPRESNTEGGVFPAIFGTVLMVFLMTFAVTPFGVLAALYLREYAREGPLVRLVRIAVNNLAGVPSIVFGIFGLGFFVYLVGGTIDRTFFADALPAPTFGTGGILWASLTLALLTVPVVIVATEEGLAAVPRVVRQGSLALGATKFETIRKVVVPAAAPGILTGVILAIARAAGEVAPLMIVGMVKLAPAMPVDGQFPFLHLERKFMHLGFHIYDLGFQSPNVEATKPLVYATALLLVVLVTAMNLVAIVLRNRLRRQHAGTTV